jgi:hypothetical protein
MLNGICDLMKNKGAQQTKNYWLMMQNKKQLSENFITKEKNNYFKTYDTTNEQFIGKFGRVHEYETEFCNPLLNSSPGMKNVAF